MSRRNRHNKIEDLHQDHFTYRKTTYHGFPSGPSALAYDAENQLLVLGTKFGELRVFGRPGVEFRALTSTKSAITTILCVSAVHQLVTVSEDNSITLWELNTEGHPTLAIIKELTFDSESGRTITKCCLSSHSGHLYFGTEGGEVFTLDLKHFRLDPDVINWANATTLMQPSSPTSKAHPGKVVSLELCPINHNLMLIGYEKGVIALWDFESSLATKNFPANVQDCHMPLESISWLGDGIKFVTSHSNSSLNYWNLMSCTPSEGPVMHYGNDCAAVNKVQWLNTDSNPLIIFSGGLPNDQADEHHTVTVIQGADHVVLDFTSAVIDFTTLSDPTTSRGSVLFVLCEQELAAFDLEAPKCPQIHKPYLYCLHASPVTCVRMYENCSNQLFQALHEVTVTSPPAHAHKSTMEWPAMGGCVRASEPNVFDILITGHENGMVKFWDITNGAMTLIYELKTSNLFVGQEPESALMMEEFSEFKWPPYHKVSKFDPFEDDPRLAIKVIEFCPNSRTLCIGGNGGQVISFSLNPSPSESALEIITAEIFRGVTSRRRGASSFGNAQRLEFKEALIQFPAGFQANFCMQCTPATAISALDFMPGWGLIAAGNSKGFVVANFLLKQIVLIHPTVLSDGVGSRSISRMQSLRRSLRGSMRQRRNSSIGANHRGRLADSQRTETSVPSRSKSVNAQRPRSHSEPASSLLESSTQATDNQVPPEMVGHVTHLCFSDTHVSGGGTSPTLFASTMGSFVARYSLTLPDPRERMSQINKVFPAGKDYALVHAAPIVCMFVLDYDGIPIPGPYEIESKAVSPPNARSPHYAVVCTSEQIKIISLPGMKQKRKEKVSDRIHERIFKAWLVRVKVPAAPVGAARDWNPALAILTTSGTFLAYSLPGLRLCFRQNEMLDMNDHKAMQSFTVSTYGEILYLHSFSELERSLLCSYGFSYHASMLPNLFPFEGSTRPISFPTRSSVVSRRQQVVQVEVASEPAAGARDRRSETPSPEDMLEGSSSKPDDGALTGQPVPSTQTSVTEVPNDATASAAKKSKSPEAVAQPSDKPRVQSTSSSGSDSSSSESESSGEEDEVSGQGGATFGNPFAMGLEGLDEGNQELDNIIASSLQQLESARAFYEHMQARAKKSE